MKKAVYMRLGILAILMLISALTGFAELGVATAFDMKFEGMGYLEYLHAFYSVPWHTALAGIVLVVVFTVATEVIYRGMKEN